MYMSNESPVSGEVNPSKSETKRSKQRKVKYPVKYTKTQPGGDRITIRA